MLQVVVRRGGVETRRWRDGVSACRTPTDEWEMQIVLSAKSEGSLVRFDALELFKIVFHIWLNCGCANFLSFSKISLEKRDIKYFLKIFISKPKFSHCNDNLLHCRMPNTCGQVINTWRQLLCCDCTSVNMSWNQWEMHTEVPHHVVRLPIIVDGVWRLAEPKAIDYGRCVNTSHGKYEMAKYLSRCYVCAMFHSQLSTFSQKWLY